MDESAERLLVLCRDRCQPKGTDEAHGSIEYKVDAKYRLLCFVRLIMSYWDLRKLYPQMLFTPCEVWSWWHT